MDRIERAAKAHYEATTDERVELKWDDCHPSYREQQKRAMRIALEAFNETSPPDHSEGPKSGV